VHRDLKPDNCWLQQVRDESQRIVKILDLFVATPSCADRKSCLSV